MSASSRTPASVHASPHDSPPPKHPPPSPATHPPQRPRTNISRASHGRRRCCASSHMYMRRKTRLRTLPRPHTSYRPASTPSPLDASAVPRFGSCRSACTRLRSPRELAAACSSISLRVDLLLRWYPSSDSCPLPRPHGKRPVDHRLSLKADSHNGFVIVLPTRM